MNFGGRIVLFAKKFDDRSLILKRKIAYFSHYKKIANFETKINIFRQKLKIRACFKTNISSLSSCHFFKMKVVNHVSPHHTIFRFSLCFAKTFALAPFFNIICPDSSLSNMIAGAFNLAFQNHLH